MAAKAPKMESPSFMSQDQAPAGSGSNQPRLHNSPSSSHLRRLSIRGAAPGASQPHRRLLAHRTLPPRGRDLADEPYWGCLTQMSIRLVSRDRNVTRSWAMLRRQCGLLTLSAPLAVAFENC